MGDARVHAHAVDESRPSACPAPAARGLSRPQAAAYVGVGTTMFDDMVKDGRMPPPKRVNARTIWDRFELDICFDQLPTDGANAESQNAWD